METGPEHDELRERADAPVTLWWIVNFADLGRPDKEQSNLWYRLYECERFTTNTKSADIQHLYDIDFKHEQEMLEYCLDELAGDWSLELNSKGVYRSALRFSLDSDAMAFQLRFADYNINKLE